MVANETAAWSPNPNPNALRGRVAVVAGATRGAGRGIAAGLGEAGATVTCTGRSSRTGSLTSDYSGRTETIEDTAELVTVLGGTGIALPVDHLDPEQVGRLAEQISDDHDHIDVLVTSHHLLPLLINRTCGLLVEVTDGATAYNAGQLPDLGLLRLAKVAVNRLA